MMTGDTGRMLLAEYADLQAMPHRKEARPKPSERHDMNGARRRATPRRGYGNPQRQTSACNVSRVSCGVRSEELPDLLSTISRSAASLPSYDRTSVFRIVRPVVCGG